MPKSARGIKRHDPEIPVAARGFPPYLSKMAGGGETRGIDRRTVLVGGGLGAGLLLAWGLWPRSYEPNLRAAADETVLGAYLKIGRDGRVTVAVPQAELGQGAWTSLPQLLADELGADWRTVGVEPAPINPVYANRLLAEEATDAGLPSAFQGLGRWAAREYATRSALMITGGSTSVRAFEAPMREAGAAARALLQMAAAERWDAEWRSLDAYDGFVWNGPEKIAFAELAEAAPRFALPEHLPVRGGMEHRLAGQALPRLDAPAKVDGSALFAADVRLPDMVFAAVRSGPKGSRLAGFDREAGTRVPGALAVFENPEWIGVAAANGWAAGKAIEAMRPRFEIPAGLPDSASIEAALTRAIDSGEGGTVYEAGDVAAAFEGIDPVTAFYTVGLAPGAPIETLTATARVTGDRLEVWAPTQAPALARAAAARAAGFGEGQVTVYPMLIGGGYGRKLETDAIEQAAVMAKKIGRPVQLSWPRIQEIRRDRWRPAAAGLINAHLGEGGAVSGWKARIAAPSSVAETAARIGAGDRLIRPEAAAVAGAVPPYDLPAVGVEHVPAELGVETGIWRSGAHSYTAFFTESFIDELARASGIEPLSFRMQMLSGNPRLARVLTTATALGGWDGGVPGSGMGLAALSAWGSHIATMVEIEIGGDQSIRVLRAVCAVDCGRAVNPGIVRQQIEGGLIHGISQAIGPGIRIEDGLPLARTIGDLGLPALKDAPEVTVEILESQDDAGGITELAVPTAAPAIANAVFALTGQRLRALPLALGSGR